MPMLLHACRCEQDDAQDTGHETKSYVHSHTIIRHRNS